MRKIRCAKDQTWAGTVNTVFMFLDWEEARLEKLTKAQDEHTNSMLKCPGHDLNQDLQAVRKQFNLHAAYIEKCIKIKK